MQSLSKDASQVSDAARVLVVDDNRVNRQLLTALLERNGDFVIDLAEDGEEALRRITTVPPDIILLDLMMPKLDGFEMCRRLRENPLWQEIPVLVQSSLNRPQDRARAFAAGATDYIAKPINVVELVSRVRIHLQNRALVSDLQQFRRRTESELWLARKMQERLLPDRQRLSEALGELGLHVDSLFAPSFELGGDLWGCRRIDRDRGMIYIVDFSGHGVGAALNTFRLHAIIQGMDVAGMTPSRFLEAVNQRLCMLLPIGQFATMLAAVIDAPAGRCVYASAGATSPMYWRKGDRAPSLADSSGLPLGLLPSATYDDRELPLPEDGRLFLYSDAAIEIPVADGVFDESGLSGLVSERLMVSNARGSLDKLSVALSSVGAIDDDLTLVLLHRE